MIIANNFKRIIEGSTDEYRYSSDLGISFSDELPIISNSETYIIAENKTTTIRTVIKFEEFSSLNIYGVEKEENESICDFIADFFKEERKINVEKYDDFYNLVIKNSVDIAKKVFNQLNYPEKNIEYYTEKCAEYRIKIPEGLLESESISEEEKKNFLKEMIENQFSLDNLTKSGIRSYYESLGYEDVSVKYDKVNKKLSLYSSTTKDINKTCTAIMVNGEVDLNSILNEGEELKDINEIFYYSSSGEKTVLFSKSEILEKISNNQYIYEGIKEEMLDIVDNKIIINSSLLKLEALKPVPGLYDGDVNELYKKIFSTSFYKFIKLNEYDSSILIHTIKRIKDRISEFNKIKDEVYPYMEIVNQSLKLSEEEITTLENSFNILIERAININEKIGELNTDIEKAEKDRISIINAVEESIPESDIKEYINKLTIIQEKVEEIEERLQINDEGGLS